MNTFKKSGFKSQPLPAPNEAGTIGGILQKSKNPNREKRQPAKRDGTLSNEEFRKLGERQVSAKFAKQDSPTFVKGKNDTARHDA